MQLMHNTYNAGLLHSDLISRPFLLRKSAESSWGNQSWLLKVSIFKLSLYWYAALEITSLLRIIKNYSAETFFHDFFFLLIIAEGILLQEILFGNSLARILLKMPSRVIFFPCTSS